MEIIPHKKTQEEQTQLNQEEDIFQIFNKHKNQNNKNKNTIIFNDSEIKKNKKTLKKFQEYNLIKETNHFHIEENPLDENENNEKNNNFENEDYNYFNEIEKQTIENNFYSSYADYFDKLNNNNTKENFNIISCAACFTLISNESENFKNFKNFHHTKKLQNFYLDYLETKSTKDLLDYFNKSFDLNKNVNFNFNLKNENDNDDSEMHKENTKENQVNNFDLDFENTSIKQYITAKCNECDNVIGFFDSFRQKYYIVNCI